MKKLILVVTFLVTNYAAAAGANPPKYDYGYQNAMFALSGESQANLTNRLMDVGLGSRISNGGLISEFSPVCLALVNVAQKNVDYSQAMQKLAYELKIIEGNAPTQTILPSFIADGTVYYRLKNIGAYVDQVEISSVSGQSLGLVAHPYESDGPGILIMVASCPTK